MQYNNKKILKKSISTIIVLRMTGKRTDGYAINWIFHLGRISTRKMLSATFSLEVSFSLSLSLPLLSLSLSFIHFLLDNLLHTFITHTFLVFFQSTDGVLLLVSTRFFSFLSFITHTKVYVTRFFFINKTFV